MWNAMEEESKGAGYWHSEVWGWLQKSKGQATRADLFFQVESS